MPLKIRPAKPEDAEALAAAEQSWAAEPGYLVSSPDELLVDNFTKKIEYLATEPNGIYIVAQDHSDIIGHALLDPMGLRSLCHIARLTIVMHKGHEGKRMGGQLLDYLISWAEENATIEKIELNVRATNTRAIRLYESRGFQQEGALKNRIKTPSGDYIDEVLMGLMTP